MPFRRIVHTSPRRTSVLDQATESAPIDRLLRALPATGIIAITHRDSVVRRMARVIDIQPAGGAAGLADRPGGV